MCFNTCCICPGSACSACVCACSSSLVPTAAVMAWVVVRDDTSD